MSRMRESNRCRTRRLALRRASAILVAIMPIGIEFSAATRTVICEQNSNVWRRSKASSTPVEQRQDTSLRLMRNTRCAGFILILTDLPMTYHPLSRMSRVRGISNPGRKFRKISREWTKMRHHAMARIARSFGCGVVSCPHSVPKSAQRSNKSHQRTKPSHHSLALLSYICASLIRVLVE